MIIALTGPAGAGKDTAGSILKQHHGFATLAFADPLRDMLRALVRHTPISEADIANRVGKEAPQPFIAGASLRHCMQTLGTEWGRNLIDQNLWINIARHRITIGTIGGQSLAITDARFDNEAEMVIAMGGQVWAINRPQATPVQAHVSEAGISEHLIARHIDNSGSHDHLARQLDAAIAQVLS